MGILSELRTANRPRLAGRIIGLAAFLIASASAWAQPAQMPWHLPEWRYRQVVEVIGVRAETAINTGLIELSIPADSVLPNGADLRVMDAVGRPVEIQRVDEKGEPLDPSLPNPNPIRLHFHITDPSVTWYLAYYGNPEAEAAFATWTKEMAGLVLETRENTRDRNARNWDMMVRMVANSRKRFGRGERRQINDSENPFGSSEQFISIYRGLIYCPEDGSYEFATDSDDSSFLLIDNQLVVDWPGPHNESGKFDHVGSITLTAGAHRIEYYHVQDGGGTLARAGWRPPSAPTIMTIPESAFLRELRTTPLWVEDRENPCTAFFQTKSVDAFRFSSAGPGFVKIKFLNRSRSGLSPIALNEWHFGDGTVSLESEPERLFRGGQTFNVSLRVTDALGFEGVYEKPLVLSALGERRIDITMEVAVASPIIGPDEPVEAVVKCRGTAGEEFPFRLVSTVKEAGEIVQRTEEKVVLPKEDWVTVRIPLPPSSESTATQEADFGLEYEGAPVGQCNMRVVRSAGSLGDLKLAQGRITDPQGTLVVLRLSGERVGRSPESFASRLEGGRARVVILDDLLGEGPNAYPQRYVELLKQRYPRAEVELEQVAMGSEGGSQTLLRALFSDYPQVKNADVVILAASWRSVLHFLPVERFERETQALAEHVAAETSAPIILVAPPPALTNPGLSQAYAIAVKRVGLRLGIPVADAYAAFVRGTERDPLAWREYYRDRRSEVPVYTVAPGDEGQKQIARAIESATLGE